MSGDYIIGGRKEDHEQVAKSTPKISMDSPKEFLRHTTVAALFPENRTKIITVQHDAPLSEGFSTLVEHGIQSVPVYDSRKNTYVGFLDMLDMVHTIVELCKEAEITGGGFNQLLASSTQLKQKKCGQVVDASGRNPFYPVEENAPVAVALQIVVSNNVHRIPVVDPHGDLVSVVTQSHLVKLFRDNHSKFDVMTKKIGDLKLGYKDVLTVKSSQRAIDAFHLIHDKKVSGVAVVDDKGELVGNISASDLKHLLIEKNFNIARVFLPIAEFLKVTSDKPIQIHSVTPEDTVGDAFEKVVTTKSHRVYVIDDKNKLLGVISLVDLLKLINP